MFATSIDPEREDVARDPFDAQLQELKRKNRQHRRALDGIVGEIHARMAESPRQRFACDLLSILAANAELVQGVPGADTWKDLPDLAEKCLEAAGKIYPEPTPPADLDFTESFDARDWARAFVKTVEQNPAVASDEGTMIGWFANALMRGYDERARGNPQATFDDDESRDSGAHPGVMLRKNWAEEEVLPLPEPMTRAEEHIYHQTGTVPARFAATQRPVAEYSAGDRLYDEENS